MDLLLGNVVWVEHDVVISIDRSELFTKWTDYITNGEFGATNRTMPDVLDVSTHTFNDSGRSILSW